MHAAALRVELRVRNAQSLKAKRHIVKSLLALLTSKFSVAVAEVDYQDKWQRATIGIASVASSPGQLDRILHTVRMVITEWTDVEVLRYAVSYIERPE